MHDAQNEIITHLGYRKMIWYDMAHHFDAGLIMLLNSKLTTLPGKI